MVRENSDVKPVERKNAVQLLRKATLTRLNKPKDEGEPSAEVYVIDLDDNALQKAKEKYPGFIPDAEVLERGVNNKKHNLKNIKHSKLKQGSKVKHSPSNSGDSGSSKRKTYTRSRVNNIHSNLLTRKAQSHRKSKLHLNQLRLTNPFKEDRFSTTSGELTVQNSIPLLPSPGQIYTPDPLGFLASKYDQKNEAENKNLLVSEDVKFPIIKKAHLRRSRSFNISNHGLNGNALFDKEVMFVLQLLYLMVLKIF
ncbi:hypothetical protein K502DRAFT_104198 [Neoconidiobolus thromboides FSU 785]|nr:hypothetical protein K502DRAFT_104198 [Neoconidiobolus thromboides FSU 785]